MIITRKSLSRRTMLRGAGAAVALPFLDAMVPALSRAQTRKSPVRMAIFYLPNGMEMRHWNPAYEGKLAELPRTLKPLEPFRDDILMLSNLTQARARKWAEGGGDHGRCCANYLTGVHPRKTLTDIRSGTSFDQLMARETAGATRFPTLEVGLEEPRQGGQCDDGYSCAYTNNLSWKSPTQPMPPIANPRSLFERLFGAGATFTPGQRAWRAALRGGIVDFVKQDVQRLQGDLGPGDKRRLDEYLTTVRDVERQIERSETDVPIEPGIPRPHGMAPDFDKQFALMTDMISIAFQADLTRIVTFLITREQTSRAYHEIGISDGHHALSHHRYIPEMMEKVAQINQYHCAQFAKWFAKFRAIQEPDGSLLDNSMIVFGSGLADGNNHLHHDLPTLILGRAGGHIKTGRRVVYRRETPMCNLWLTAMDRMGVRMEKFGDSTGHLPGLDLA